MAQRFHQAIATKDEANGARTWDVPDGWQQGRGAFGGVVLGALLDAMMAQEPDGARLARTFTGDICGPVVVGPARITTRVLRRGKNQTNLSATLEQDGVALAQGSCVLATERRVPDVQLGSTMLPPERPSYESGVISPIGPPIAPVFTQHYEFRNVGPVPFGGGKEALILGWVKERVPEERVTAPLMIGRLDAHWPSVFSTMTAPRPVATVSFLAELLCDPKELDPKAPLFYRARTVAQAGGYVVELRELWLEDRIVAMNQQSVAMIA